MILLHISNIKKLFYSIIIIIIKKMKKMIFLIIISKDLNNNNLLTYSLIKLLIMNLILIVLILIISINSLIDLIPLYPILKANYPKKSPSHNSKRKNMNNCIIYNILIIIIIKTYHLIEKILPILRKNHSLLSKEMKKNMIDYYLDYI